MRCDWYIKFWKARIWHTVKVAFENTSRKDWRGLYEFLLVRMTKACQIYFYECRKLYSVWDKFYAVILHLTDFKPLLLQLSFVNIWKKSEKILKRQAKLTWMAMYSIHLAVFNHCKELLEFNFVELCRVLSSMPFVPSIL